MVSDTVVQSDSLTTWMGGARAGSWKSCFGLGERFSVPRVFGSSSYNALDVPSRSNYLRPQLPSPCQRTYIDGENTLELCAWTAAHKSEGRVGRRWQVPLIKARAIATVPNTVSFNGHNKTIKSHNTKGPNSILSPSAISTVQFVQSSAQYKAAHIDATAPVTLT